MTENANGSGMVEDAVAAIANATPKPASAAAARIELAPTRALAAEYLETFNGLVAKHLPAIQKAADKYNLAAQVGIVSTELRTALMQAFNITSGGANAFTGIIAEIDALKDFDVAMRWHFSIPSRLAAFKSNIGALTRVVTEIEAHLVALEQRVLTTAPVRQQPVMAIHVPRTASMAVETMADRDPREAA